MRIRAHGFLAALGFAGVLLSPAAFAQQTTTQESVFDRSGSLSDGSNTVTVRGALLDKARNDYGPLRLEDGRLKGGREYELSAARLNSDVSTDALGGISCENDLRFLTADVGATVEVGLPQFSSTFGGESSSSSSTTSSGRQTAARAARLFGDCNASAEVALVRANVECETVVGTFEVDGEGASADASCGCSGCEAGASLFWIEGEWTSPTIGACGVEGSVILGAGGGVGVRAGARTVGTAGANVTAGPVELTAGVDVTRFDAGEAWECVENAAAFVADAASAVGNGIANAASSLGDGLVSLFNRVRPRFDNPLPNIGIPTGSGSGAASGWVRP